jgi:uncharacterized Rossmann fold enzyme
LKLEEWLNEWYPKITRELKIDPREDQKAAFLLDKLVPEESIALKEASDLIHGRTCAVIGAGPSLRRVLPKVVKIDDSVWVCADGAARAFFESALIPHILVTDLDGGDELIEWCAKSGSILVIHAHADNVTKISQLVPKLVQKGARIIPTTQTKPIGKVRNFVGFTDGDRAAWFCHEMGASKIVLAAMDFGLRIGGYSKPRGYKLDRSRKLKKLRIGEELIKRLSKEACVCILKGSRRIAGIELCN